MAPDETWAPVPGFPGYEASTLGRVRSVDRELADGRAAGGVVLAQVPDPRGYMRVTLRRDRRPVTCLVHQLVLAAHVGLPGRGHEVLHLNDRKDDNSLPNLRYGSRNANTRARERHKREKRNRSLLTRMRRL